MKQGMSAGRLRTLSLGILGCALAFGGLLGVYPAPPPQDGAVHAAPPSALVATAEIAHLPMLDILTGARLAWFALAPARRDAAHAPVDARAREAGLLPPAAPGRDAGASQAAERRPLSWSSLRDRQPALVFLVQRAYIGLAIASRLAGNTAPVLAGQPTLQELLTACAVAPAMTLTTQLACAIP